MLCLQNRGCDWVRIQQLQTVLCKFLCGLDPPVLRLQKTPDGEVFLPAVSSGPSTNNSPTPPITPDPGESEKVCNLHYFVAIAFLCAFFPSMLSIDFCCVCPCSPLQRSRTVKRPPLMPKRPRSLTLIPWAAACRQPSKCFGCAKRRSTKRKRR